MEKKKNNAIEKAENAAKNNAANGKEELAVKNDAAKPAGDKPSSKKRATANNGKTKSAKKSVSKASAGKKNEAKKTAKGKNGKKAEKLAAKYARAEEKKRIKEELRAKKLAAKNAKKRERESAEAEKERIRAEKRVEIARIKAHKKAEREKAKATALRDKNRRIAEAKARKAEIKAEKQKRRDARKSETKKQRAERIAAERAAKLSAKKEMRAQKAEERKQRFLAKKERRKRRDETRQKNKEQRRGFGGWLAAVISLGCATLVLASVLTFVFLMPTAEENMLEASYRKSFYDTVDQVDNMDVNLSKVMATKDAGAAQGYLLDLAVNSELAESDVQQLPLQDESKHYTTKIINQIGDYAKYLHKKIVAGEKLTDKEYENLANLKKANESLKNALAEMTANMSGDYNFTAMTESGNGDIVINNFNELQNLSAEYPELIYDGPFSDGKDRREIKGITGENISEATAKDIFSKLFIGFNPTDVRNDGMTESGIRCFNISGTTDGELLYAQISEKGGKLVMFAYSGSCKKVNVDDDLATEKGLEFLEAAGVEGMTPVWINLANNVYTVNYASEKDGVIIYSDLIKIRVCAETGNVIGMEATSYYMNHTERTLAKPAITEKTARENVSGNIDVVTCRLAVIPVGETTEKLCYEFSGTFEGDTYYVYIDAATGRQVEMFKVVKSSEGELLI